MTWTDNCYWCSVPFARSNRIICKRFELENILMFFMRRFCFKFIENCSSQHRGTTNDIHTVQVWNISVQILSGRYSTPLWDEYGHMKECTFMYIIQYWWKSEMHEYQLSWMSIPSYRDKHLKRKGAILSKGNINPLHKVLVNIWHC